MENGSISVSNLTRTYRNRINALDNISFSVNGGDFVTMIGRSGSGKSSLLNILGCLDTPSDGSVHLNGRLVNYQNRSELIQIRQRSIGFIFQHFNLIPHLTAQENVEYPLLFNYHPREERQRRASELLERVGLSSRSDHYPNEMSGGEQQRVAIARALVHHPTIILADEPTGNLDSKTSSDIFQLMRQVNEERKTTFFVVTHEREYRSFADRCLELSDGGLFEC